MGENTNSNILGFGGRLGKSSTETTRHVTASQNCVGNKPKTLLWHSEARISEMIVTELLTEKERTYFLHF